MLKHKSQLSSVLGKLREALASSSRNRGYGYHGLHKSEVADRKYSSMHRKVKAIAGKALLLTNVKSPNSMVTDYLDSTYGRHLSGFEDDEQHIAKSFATFKKTYNREEFKREWGF